MKKALIFDFFGTLVSTPDSLFVGEGRRTWQLLKKYGYDIEFEVFKRNWEDCLIRMEEASNINCVEFHFFNFVRVAPYRDLGITLFVLGMALLVVGFASDARATEEEKLVPEKVVHRHEIGEKKFFCRYCGAENKHDAGFCERCGKKL